MARWWLVTIAVAGAWLVVLGSVEFGLFARLSLGALDQWIRPGIFGVLVIVSVQCARQGSAAWCGILAFLAAMLNPVAPPEWRHHDWEHGFEIAAGLLMAAFSVRQWK
jgi:hypothetical protein